MESLTDGRTPTDPKAVAQAKLAEDPGPFPHDVFRHYKGGLYSVVCVSVHESDLTPMVTYRSNLKGTYWTRTRDNFMGWVNTPGRGLEPRFKRERD